MENNVFKTGAVMDLVANAEVVNEQVENLQDASNAQKVTSHAYKYLGKTNTIVREFVKIGRNDECPCGSGKKYKKCCLDSGKYEKQHQLTTMEKSDVRNGKRTLASISKDAYSVNDEE